MTRPQVSVALVVLFGLCAAGAGAEPRGFEVTVLPELSTPFGAFERVEGVALNNRGEAVGRACGVVRSTEGGCAAFRAHRGVIEDRDPDGRYQSEAIALNRRGVLLGKFLRGAETRYFKTARNGSIDFLDRGLPGSDSEGPRVGFFIRSFNDRGAVVADVSVKGRRSPYIWRDSVGSWEPLTAGEPEFAGELSFEGINDRGDAVLVAREERSSAAYLYRQDRSIVVIRPMAAGFLILLPPTDAGAVSGRIFQDDSDKAVYFDLAGGLRSIHPDGYRHSYALQLLEDGTALVAATRGALHGPVVFFFTYHPAEGLRQLWTKAELETLRERAGCGKPNRNKFYAIGMNRKREFLATLVCAGGRGAVHFSRETGFTLLRDVLAEHGFETEWAEARDINDRGQMLLSSLIDDRLTAVVVSPRR